MGIVSIIALFLRAVFLPRAVIAAENLALRQQLGVLRRSAKRPRLRQRDRILWVWLSRLWPSWRSCLLIVKPETVIYWHRQGFRLYWRWKSRKRGRPKVDAQMRKLIKQLSTENRLWTAERIHDHLVLLGFDPPPYRYYPEIHGET